jgi:hypothetical protein
MKNLFREEQLSETGKNSQAKEPAGFVSQSKSNPNMPIAKGSKQKVFHVLVFSSRIGQWENRNSRRGLVPWNTCMMS